MIDYTFPDYGHKSGFYTVNIDNNGIKEPHIVFAASDLHAARLVSNKTGYLAKEHEVEGPYQTF